MYAHEEAINRIKDENNRMLMRRGHYRMIQLAMEMYEANVRELTPTMQNKVMNQVQFLSNYKMSDEDM